MLDFLTNLFTRGPKGWHLVDPSPEKARSPYTFFTPSEAAIEALEPGDIVKMFFEQDDGKAPVERMWVIYQGRDEDGMYGTLDNKPFYMTTLKLHDEVRFQPWHITSVLEPRVDDPKADAWEDRMFTRARVAPAVLDGATITRLERRSPEPVEGVQFDDTGWYILSDDATPEDDLEFIAIGAILNRDDSILPYLDAPVGTALTRRADGTFADA